MTSKWCPIELASGIEFTESDEYSYGPQVLCSHLQNGGDTYFLIERMLAKQEPWESANPQLAHGGNSMNIC